MKTQPQTPAPRPKFATLVIDAPTKAGQGGKYGAGRWYPLMSNEQIASMPIGDLAAENAHLYMWCYPATRRSSEEMMENWGFTFKDEFVWGKDHMGLGPYFRHAHETLLLGVRGRLPFQFHGQRSFNILPRQEHSRKPEEVHVMIERCSPGPFLELFARRRPPTRGDWWVWGNEVDSDIVIAGYPVPTYSERAQP